METKNKLLREKYAYLAGFFDGEGCISLCKLTNKKGRVHYKFAMRCSNTKIEPLLLFRDVFGGSIRKVVNVRKGKSNRKMIYRYQLQCRKAIEALIKLRPYLINKSPIVKMLDKLLSTWKPWGVGNNNMLTTKDKEIRDEFIVNLRKINKRGVK